LEAIDSGDAPTNDDRWLTNSGGRQMRFHAVCLTAVAALACFSQRSVRPARREPGLHSQDCAARVGGKVYCREQVVVEILVDGIPDSDAIAW
jgi:hypothetical protein